MTCATCHGMKDVKRQAPPHWRLPNEAVDQSPGYVRVPCPDCQPKPFAQVVRVGGGRRSHELRIDGQGIDGAYLDAPDVLQENADRINAAVEAREAKLRGATFDALVPVISAYTGGMSRSAGVFLDSIRATLAELRLTPETRDYVSGHVACGLAFDLGVMQGYFHGSWQVMLDALMESGGQSSELALALADHLGVKLRPHMYKMDRDGNFEAITFNSMTDEQLAQECVRRGWSFEPPGRADIGFSARITGFDPAQPGGDHTVAAFVRGREVVRIMNVETFGIPERVEALGPVLELLDRELSAPPAARSIASPDGHLAAPCVNRQCSRFNTRHGGIPCDTRRARGVGGKR